MGALRKKDEKEGIIRTETADRKKIIFADQCIFPIHKEKAENGFFWDKVLMRLAQGNLQRNKRASHNNLYITTVEGEKMTSSPRKNKLTAIHSLAVKLDLSVPCSHRHWWQSKFNKKMLFFLTLSLPTDFKPYYTSVA